MKKENDVILIPLVMIMVLFIVLVSISINLILGENRITQKIKQEQEVSTEQMNGEEARMQIKIDNK